MAERGGFAARRSARGIAGRGLVVAILSALVLTPALLALARPRSVNLAGTAAAITTSRLRYGVVDGRPLYLDEFSPSAHRGALPGVLVVHGGGWSHGSPAGSAGLARRLAAAGFAAFDVEYALDGRDWPGLTDQPAEIEAAARFVVRQARWLGVRAGGIGALGSSAGGNLVVRAAFAQRSPFIAAVVSWSGPMDLEDFRPLVERACTAVTCGRHWLATDLVDYVGCLPRECPERWALGSPLVFAHRGAPATLLFNSAHEFVPLHGAEALAARLREADVPVRLVVLPGRRHAGQYAASALGPTITFLRDRLTALR